MKAPLLALLALLAVEAGAQAQLTRAPAPSWVKTTEWQPPESRDNGTDYEDYVREFQVNLVTHEQYVRYAFRYLTLRAVQNDSTVRLDYAPDYQTVRLHTLTLWRDGRPIDQKAIPFRDVQRESGLEESLYDGEHTWVGFLKDVRPGDVLEAAYTITGDNPIFGGRYADTFHVETSYPVDRWTLRLLAPSGRSPELRALNTAVRPAKASWNDLEETILSADNVGAVENDNLAPPDIDARGRYVLSDWRTWDEVVRWALPLYTPETDAEIAARAAELTRGKTSAEDRALALLEFVQDHIRYLGIEVGVNSHQPRPAAEVLGNGFGDCKDKVMLFCSLAAASGVQAWPVLVHTRNGALVNDEGPTPLAFNHVIAAVASPRGTVYVDPTADQQGGPLAERVVGPFAYGLEVKPGVQTLTALPPQASAGRRELKQTYRFRSFQEPASVAMEYSYFGSDADAQRRRWEGLTPAQWRKDTAEWLKDQYDDATLTGDPVTSDDRAANVFRLSFSFSLRGYWKKAAGTWRADFYPSLVGSSLYDPDRVIDRNVPYALEHPETVRQVRRVELPEDWSIEASDQTLGGPGFALESSVRQLSPRVIEITDEYRSVADRVEPRQWNEYLEALNKARDGVFWTLTWTPPATRSSAAPAAGHSEPDEVTPPGGFEAVGNIIVGITLFFLFAAFQGSDF